MADPCCALGSIERPVDLSSTFGSGIAFLQKNGLLRSPAAPLPRICPADFRDHTRPLVPPYPLPELLQELVGDPPTDAGRSVAWPYPNLTTSEA